MIDDLEQLFEATAPDFTPVYRGVRDTPMLEVGRVLPGERTFTVA